MGEEVEGSVEGERDRLVRWVGVRQGKREGPFFFLRNGKSHLPPDGL